MTLTTSDTLADASTLSSTGSDKRDLQSVVSAVVIIFGVEVTTTVLPRRLCVPYLSYHVFFM